MDNEFTRNVDEVPGDIVELKKIIDASKKHDEDHKRWEEAKRKAEEAREGFSESEPQKGDEATRGEAVRILSVESASNLSRLLSEDDEKAKGYVEEKLRELEGVEGREYVAAGLLEKFLPYLRTENNLQAQMKILENTPNAIHFLGEYANKMAEKIVSDGSNISAKTAKYGETDKMISFLLEKKAGELSSEQKEELSVISGERAGYRKFGAEINSGRNLEWGKAIEPTPKYFIDRIRGDLGVVVNDEVVKSALESVKYNENVGFFEWDVASVVMTVGRVMEGEEKAKLWGYGVGLVERNVAGLDDIASNEAKYFEVRSLAKFRSEAAAKALISMLDPNKDVQLYVASGRVEKREKDERRADSIKGNESIFNKVNKLIDVLQNNVAAREILSKNSEEDRRKLDDMDGTTDREMKAEATRVENLKEEARTREAEMEVLKQKRVVESFNSYNTLIMPVIDEVFKATEGNDWKGVVAADSKIVDRIKKNLQGRQIDGLESFVGMVVGELKGYIVKTGNGELVRQEVDNPNWIRLKFSATFNNKLYYDARKIQEEIDKLPTGEYSLEVEAKRKALEILLQKAGSSAIR